MTRSIWRWHLIATQVEAGSIPVRVSNALVAQCVESLFCTQVVAGSNPV